MASNRANTWCLSFIVCGCFLIVNKHIYNLITRHSHDIKRYNVINSNNFQDKIINSLINRKSKNDNNDMKIINGLNYSVDRYPSHDSNVDRYPPHDSNVDPRRNLDKELQSKELDNQEMIIIPSKDMVIDRYGLYKYIPRMENKKSNLISYHNDQNNISYKNTINKNLTNKVENDINLINDSINLMNNGPINNIKHNIMNNILTKATKPPGVSDQYTASIDGENQSLPEEHVIDLKKRANPIGGYSNNNESTELKEGTEAGPDFELWRARALRLKDLITQTTIKCNKLVRVGGRGCVKNYDGAKMVCLDLPYRPMYDRCIIYSFGVGNDFTFDIRMQDYGCEVHSFDHDEVHDFYTYRMGPRLYFHKMRIGIRSRIVKFCDYFSGKKSCDKPVRYSSLDDIMSELNHNTSSINYIKMDIEGGEWDILSHILDTSDVLNYTSQIAVEIHLEDIFEGKTLSIRREGVLKYLNVMERLMANGFQVTHYETNDMSIQTAIIDQVTFRVYAEILLLKVNKI